MLQFFSPPHLTKEAAMIAEKNRDQTGLVFATSGTSGSPKWILHSQAGLDWCARTVNEHFSCTARDVWGLALPSFHVGGYGVQHRARLAGGALHTFAGKWNAPAFCLWAKEEAITITSLVPAQVFDLVSARLAPPPSLRLALIGGEHLPTSLQEQGEELGWPLVTSYGMTETAGLVAAARPGESNLVPLPGWQLAQTEEGLLTIAGPGLFAGHLTTAGFSPVHPPFITKDLVALTEQTLRPRGRSDDQVKVLGELVDLQAMRDSLASALPGLQTTLISLPEKRRGHLFVPVIEADSAPEIAAKVAAWNESQPAFARCEQPAFLPKWPRTPLGKVDRRALQAQVTSGRDSLLRDH